MKGHFRADDIGPNDPGPDPADHPADMTMTEVYRLPENPGLVCLSLADHTGYTLAIAMDPTAAQDVIDSLVAARADALAGLPAEGD
jgi:hypothetical protein